MSTTDISKLARRMATGGTLVLTAALGACAGEEPGALPRDADPTPVRVSQSVTTVAGGTHPATVVATRQARVATRTSGRIFRVPVDVGSRVRSGETLAVLDDTDVRARIEAAESGARLARRTFERVAALAADGAASEHELDRARSEMEAAEAELNVARAQVEYTTLRAPFDGVVTGRMADPGDLAAPGHPVLTLVGEAGRKVQADLPARRIGSVAEGDSAWVVVPDGGEEIGVRISRVSPAVSRAARRFRVEAELPAGAGLAPGAFVRLSLRTVDETTRWIPEDAVVRRGQLTGVYTVEDDRLELHWVRLGLRRPGAVEVLAGPEGAVVREPSPQLYDGRPVSRIETLDWTGPEAREEGSDR